MSLTLVLTFTAFYVVYFLHVVCKTISPFLAVAAISKSVGEIALVHLVFFYSNHNQQSNDTVQCRFIIFFECFMLLYENASGILHLKSPSDFEYTNNILLLLLFYFCSALILKYNLWKKNQIWRN